MPRSNAWPVVACFALLVAAASARAQDTAAMSAIARNRPQVQQPKLKPERSPAVRSAQGDCVREANRRGFAVLDTSNYQQSGDGWSLDLQVRDMRGRVSRGSCFVETGSGEVSLSGFRWGYDDDGDDRIEFSCASTDSRYRECQLPIDGRARLVKRRSDAPCIEGRSWGQRGDRVWVDQGCRARFEVQREAGSGQTVDCRSENGKYRECQIGPGHFGRLVREYSNGRCREDVTWGTRNGVVWVTNGCKAQFVRQRGNSGGGNGDRYVECRSRDGRYNECSVGRGYVARLVRDESGGRCRRDSTWGTRTGVVWVTNGCSGRFERVRTQY
ncbi:MAG TPA: DUF3011 domain-containing protein [Steroidobacteraceae bacterium]|nr:DUF3011 domain-containing protein [Steroidobacteraceae bacterium]